MTSRQFTADTTGPVTLDAALLGGPGTITVRAEAGCDRAVVTVSTREEEGPAADAVRQATTRFSAGRLHVGVQVEDLAGPGGPIVVTTGRHQSMTVRGNVTVIQVGGNFTHHGDLNLGQGHIVTGRGIAPVEIVAVVPEGSSVTGRSESAGIETTGALADITADIRSGNLHADRARTVTANIRSGNATVNAANQVTADIRSGSVTLNTARTVTAEVRSGNVHIREHLGTADITVRSGNIRVHATGHRNDTADLRLSVRSGNITVTADQAALDSGLNVNATTRTGSVSTPQTARR